MIICLEWITCPLDLCLYQLHLCFIRIVFIYSFIKWDDDHIFILFLYDKSNTNRLCVHITIRHMSMLEWIYLFKTIESRLFVLFICSNWSNLLEIIVFNSISYIAYLFAKRLNTFEINWRQFVFSFLSLESVNYCFVLSVDNSMKDHLKWRKWWEMKRLAISATAAYSMTKQDIIKW